MAAEPEVGTQQGTEGSGQPTETPPESADGGKKPDELAAAQAEVERLNKLHQEHLSEKTNLEELRKKYEAGPPAPQPSAKPEGFDPVQLQTDVAKLKEIAKEDSEAGAFSRLLIAVGQAQTESSSETKREFGLLKVPEPQREEVARVVEEARARGENISPTTASNLLKGQKLLEREQAIADKEKELADEVEARGRGEISTRTIPAAPAEETVTKLTFKEYGQRSDNAKTVMERDELYRRTHLLRKGHKDFIELVPG